MAQASKPLSNYPFQFEIHTRYDDLDTQKHVNNVAVANLHQEARVQFHREAFREFRQKHGKTVLFRTVLANIEITYLRETHYPYPVVAGVGIERVGNSSYSIGVSMYQNDECVGTSKAVLVFVKDGHGIQMPEEIRETLNLNLIKE
ncbi:MAG: acyl-CoA thioesterase [Cellvibrionaceae bacterium]